jgi:arsenate reductase-like glutaredoxin family protein
MPMSYGFGQSATDGASSVDRFIRDAAAIRDYLAAPPSREALAEILRMIGARPRDILRRKGTPYVELGLDDPALSDEEILGAMIANPVLIDRPAERAS